MTNDRHIVTLPLERHRFDGRQATWNKYDVQMEVSGYHHNVAGDFLSLRPGSTWQGRARPGLPTCVSARSEARRRRRRASESLPATEFAGKCARFGAGRRGLPGTLDSGPASERDVVHVMTRTPSPETKARIRQSPLPVIGAVVAIILVVFYGWSQRGWLINVTDIESRDVDMQSQQLQRGFATELEDLYQAMSDYAIWNETAEFARGNRPDYFAQSLNAGALVRLDVDTFLVLDRNLETRASLALDATSVQEYEIPPDPELLARHQAGGHFRPAERQRRPRERHRAARARARHCSPRVPIFDSTGTGQPHGWIAFARAFTPAVVERMGRFSPWPVTGFPVANLDRAGVPDEVRDWVRDLAAHLQPAAPTSPGAAT